MPTSNDSSLTTTDNILAYRLCVCVCVCERERERERDSRKKEKKIIQKVKEKLAKYKQYKNSSCAKASLERRNSCIRVFSMKKRLVELNFPMSS